MTHFNNIGWHRVAVTILVLGTMLVASLELVGRARAGDAISPSSGARPGPARALPLPVRGLQPATGTATSEPTQTVDPAQTATVQPTDTVTATATAEVTDQPTATATSTPMPTPRPTTPPRPAYLPISIKDPPCTPSEEHLDVVFVVDGSSYMKNVRRGKPAFESALEMVRWSLEAMDFTANQRGQVDQAGVVVFRHNLRGDEILELTSNRNAGFTFLDELVYGRPADKTAMTEALDRARAMLNGGRHRPANKRVVVFLSELQAKNVPYEHLPECKDLDGGNEECAVLKKASELKAGGIVIAVFATSMVGRGEELLAMASNDSLQHVLPTRATIAQVIKSLEPATPCPPENFWPRRP